MHQLPALKDILIAASIIIVSLLLGIVIKRIALHWLIKITSKTKWKGDDIIVDASKNVFILTFFIIGLYAATIYVPNISAEYKFYIFRVLRVSSILMVTVIVSRILVGWVNLYQQNTDSLLHKTSILK